VDDEACRHASAYEIIRRYYAALCDARKGRVSKEVVSKIELLMSKLSLTAEDRKPVKPALEKAVATGAPAVAIELPCGTVVTGKTGPLLGAAAGCLLNALKLLGGIDDQTDLIAPRVIQPMQRLKVKHMGAVNPRLHTDEVLMALAIGAVNNPTAKLAVEQLEKLKNCEVHSTVILADRDEKTFKALGMHVTCEPQKE
jgi:uncharacterized protein (UPF0371 family)